MLKKSTLKFTIIGLIVLLSTSCFSLLAVSLISRFKPEKDNTSAAGTLLITYGAFYEGTEKNRENNYKNNNVFQINDAMGLAVFARHVAQGNTYQGKTVELIADIDVQGNQMNPIGAKMNTGYVAGGDWGDSTNYCGMEPFRGTFDGGGHTIRNIKTEIKTNDDKTGIITKKADVYVGLFAKVNQGTIKNVKIDTYTVILHSGIGEAAVGGFVGEYKPWEVGSSYGELNIENCSLENFTIELASSLKLFASNFIGHYSLTSNYGTSRVTNCYVCNFSRTGSDVANGSMVLLMGVAKATDYTVNDQDSYKDAYQHQYFTNIVYKDMPGLAFSYVGDAVASDRYVYTGQLANHSTYMSGIHKTANSTNGLNQNSALSNKDTDPTWFYHESYNEGYPYLRQFINWINPEYKSHNTEGGTVTDAGLYEPDGVTKVYTDNNIIVCGTTVATASPNTGYKVGYWSGTTAYFVADTFTITFKLVNGTGMKVNNNTQTTDKSVTINYWTSITVTRTLYSVTYEFKEHSASNKTTITYAITNQDGEYYFKSSDFTGLSAATLYSDSSSRTITPKLTSKTFDIEFK